jgi:NADPH:quinone reductase-like Zn-dependent oxidoreductase
MRAAFITRAGPLEAIEVGELPVPVPGPTVVLVAVEVSAVKAAETFACGCSPTTPPVVRLGLATTAS